MITLRIFLIPFLLLLSACEVSTEELTPENIGGVLLRSACQSVSNCGVAQGDEESKSRH